MSVTSKTLGTAYVDDAAASGERATHSASQMRTPSDDARALKRLSLKTAHVGLVGVAEDLMHYGVAVVLMIVAGVVLYKTTYDLATTTQPVAAAATTAVNGVLFAIIIMEVMRTVMAHFDRGGLQLQPFLIIGIISAVREILSVGAHLSLQNTEHADATVHLALLELAVNAGVVVGLAAGLVLVRRLAGMREAHDVARTGNEAQPSSTGVVA